VQLKFEDQTKWLTIPILRNSGQIKLSAITSPKPDWQAHHRKVIKNSFSKTPHVEQILKLTDEVFKSDSLFETIVKSSESLAAEFGVLPKIVYRSSTFKLESYGSERILEISRILSATKYISGHGGFNYLDHASFSSNGVEIEYMKYSLKPWKQMGSTFTPFVSSLDFLASNSAGDFMHHLNPMTTNWRAGKPFIENTPGN
jgi:hypothetical protein